MSTRVEVDDYFDDNEKEDDDVDYDNYDASLIMITKIEVGKNVVSTLLVRGRESENIISSPRWP